MSSVDMLSIYVADFIGAILLFSIILTKGWIIPTRKQESKILLILILLTLIYCVFDPLSFYFDGKPNAVSYFGIFFVNTVLYLYSLGMELGFVFLVSFHLRRNITTAQKIVVAFMITTEFLLLILNTIFPLVFSIDENNLYHREPCYIVFLLFGLALVVYSWIIYGVERLKNGSLRYFPVWQFMLPTIICISVQACYYGISTQPVGFAISLSAMAISLKNECLYIDKLTGVFNRYELDKIVETLKKKKNRTIAAIMLDLNDFKAINDIYSHNEGDLALKALADILVQVVQNQGVVMRFAGDEFIIVINTADENTVADYTDAINKAISKYNKKSGKPYTLSVAIGGDIFNIKDSDDDFLQTIDELMYKNKSEYYSNHERKGRRDK